MSERSEALATLERVLDLLPANAAADVRLMRDRTGTMRFANGQIHQPHLERSSIVSLRVVLEAKIGIATAGDLTPAGLRRLAASAQKLARVAPADPKFPAFESDDGPLPKIRFSRATAEMTPEGLARLAAGALDGAREVLPDARISGAVHVGTEQLAVANTSGRARYAERAFSQGSVLAELPQRDPPVSGWAEGAHWDARRLDPAALGRRAAETVARSAPASLKPAAYRVLLQPAAFAELIGFLGFLGFNARGDEEGWGALRGKRGRKVAAPAVRLTDDGTSEDGIPQAMDYEGHAKRRHPLLVRGVAGAPVTDLRSAARAGTVPTGHGTPPESPYGDWGPTPTQQLLEPGSASFDDLVKRVKNGLLVTRFHYVRVVHAGKSTITGMTRDGTYRIENGAVTTPVKNLRFTESVLGALASVEALGRERYRLGDEGGYASITVPAAAIGRFRFNSATAF